MSRPDAAPPPPPRRAALLGLAAVTLLAMAVYANALANGFAIDDEPILLKNEVVHGLGHLRQVLAAAYWPGTHALYRPVMLFSLALQWAVHGDSTVAFHAANLLLHAAVTALLYAMLVRLGAGVRGAMLGAAAFAVHPVHVEAVSNVIGRAEVLATLFYLAACNLYLDVRRVGPGRMAALAALYLLGLGSKEIAVTLPGALVLLDAFRSRREGIGLVAIVRRNLVLMVVMAGALAVYVLTRAWVLGGVLGEGVAAYLDGIPTVERWAVAARLWPEFLRLLLWPADLSAEWAPDTLMVPTWRDPSVWLSLGLMALLAIAAVRAWKRQPWITLAIAWLALTVFPISQIPFVIGVMLAERTLYLPSVAVAFLAPAVVAVLARERTSTRRLGMAAVAVLLALGAVRTWLRTPVWKSSAAVFLSLVDEHPEVWLVDWRAGQLLMLAGRGGEGLTYFDHALAKTRFAHPAMVEELTRWLLQAGQPARAEAVLRRTLAHRPDAPVINLYLARALFDEGRYREAIASADDAYSRSPYGRQWAAEVHHLKALAYDVLERRDSALVENTASLRDARWSRTAPGWFHRARLLALAGDSAGARGALASARGRTAPAYRAALRLDPLPPPWHPAMRGWAAWRPDGTPGDFRDIAQVPGQAVAAGAAPR